MLVRRRGGAMKAFGQIVLVGRVVALHAVIACTGCVSSGPGPYELGPVVSWDQSVNGRERFRLLGPLLDCRKGQDCESFAAVLRKPATKRKRGPVFFLFPGYMDTRAQPCVVAIDEEDGKRHKLLYFYEADAWELYNLSDDIGEKTNVIEEKPELASAISRKISAWLNREHPTWKPKYPLDRKNGKPVAPPVL